MQGESLPIFLATQPAPKPVFSCQAESATVNGAVEVILNIYPPYSHMVNHFTQTTGQKSRKDHYLCRTDLQYIIPPEINPFPSMDLQYACSHFPTIAQALVLNYHLATFAMQ